MIRAYDQYRRAMAYLRWSEGDAAKLAPPLFARRRTRGATPPDGTNGLLAGAKPAKARSRR